VNGNLDPTSVRILNDNGVEVTELEVPGEGIWTVNTDTGEITFTPDPGFLGNPTPINYTVKDLSGEISNTASVRIEYTGAITDIDDGAVLLSKSANKSQISIGDQVYYTIVAENTTTDSISIDLGCS